MNEDAGSILIRLFFGAIIIFCAYQCGEFNREQYRLCEQKGGTWLWRERVCLEIKNIKMDNYGN